MYMFVVFVCVVGVARQVYGLREGVHASQQNFLTKSYIIIYRYHDKIIIQDLEHWYDQA